MRFQVGMLWAPKIVNTVSTRLAVFISGHIHSLLSAPINGEQSITTCNSFEILLIIQLEKLDSSIFSSRI